MSAALNIDDGAAGPAPHLRLVPAIESSPEIEPARSRGTSQDPAHLLTAEEAGEMLRVSAKTLANWRSKGTGLAFVKVGGRVAYRREVVLAYGLESPGFASKADPS